MQLITACDEILNQLSAVVKKLTEAEFTNPSESLSGSTIGQHLRHTLEFFICLEQGFKSGVVNYDRRSHDKLIESDKFIALSAITRVLQVIKSNPCDRPLKLEVGYNLEHDDSIIIETNYFRELTYNIEHAVHHMAIMKIGIREVAPHTIIPSDFGVAASTIRYRETSVAEAH
jgi:uncharacterized damage-inducible protein DinB